jgi:isoquinoline 1-oxidoreductase beta subunit
MRRRLADPADAPADPPLRPDTARPLVGRSVLRLDLPSKVDGSARFGGDVRVPGMVFAAIRHAPAGGTVRAVRAPAGTAVVRGPGWFAVTGPTSWAAQQALAGVQADFSAGERPAGPWMDGALAPALTAAEARRWRARQWLVRCRCAPSTACRSWRTRASSRWWRRRAWPTAAPSCGGPTQSLTLATWAVARALEIDSTAVVIHPTLVGGGFGRKAETDAMVAAALIARDVARPVQLLYSRKRTCRRASTAPRPRRAFAGRVEGGRAVAWDARIAGTERGGQLPATEHAASGHARRRAQRRCDRGCGRQPLWHRRVPGGACASHASRAARLLAVGGAQLHGVLRGKLRRRAGAGGGRRPVLFRLRMLAERPRHARVLRARGRARRAGATPRRRGMAKGVALHESFGSIVATVIEAGVKDGAVRLGRVTSAIDCGQAINPDSVRAQVEGGAIFGLSAALHQRIDWEPGGLRPAISMLPDAALRRVAALRHGDREQGGPLGGVGEPGTPPARRRWRTRWRARPAGARGSLPLAGFYTA